MLHKGCIHCIFIEGNIAMCTKYSCLLNYTLLKLCSGCRTLTAEDSTFRRFRIFSHLPAKTFWCKLLYSEATIDSDVHLRAFREPFCEIIRCVYKFTVYLFFSLWEVSETQCHVNKVYHNDVANKSSKSHFTCTCSALFVTVTRSRTYRCHCCYTTPSSDQQDI